MQKKLSVLFWTIWTVSLLVTLTESVTSTGFITASLGINNRIVGVVVILLSGLLLLFKFINKDLKVHKRDSVIYLISGTLVSLFIILKIVNRLTHPGFVFSKVHIEPNALLWPALISFVGAASSLIPLINFKKLLKIQMVLIMFTSFIIAQNFYFIYKSKWEGYKYIIANPGVSYDDKMRNRVGSLFYNYTLFINEYTPKDASLLIPPQAFPWPRSGNGGMLRYFIYPRKITNGDEYKLPTPETLKQIDYVLLNWGESDIVESPHTHDWPKFDIKAQKIIFMNEDGSFGGELKGDYLYKNYKGKKVWGLIVVKH